MSKNCILGIIYLDIWAVIDDGKNTTLGKFQNVKFYVANNEIILNYPILGNSFLQQNRVIIDYEKTDKCTISASVFSKENIVERKELLVFDKGGEMKFENLNEINSNGVENYLFQSTILQKCQN